MKTITLFTVLLSLSAAADTITHEMSDKGSQKLATLLSGKTVVCVPSEGYQPAKDDFYPVKISAEKKTDKITEVTIATKGKDVQFGFGGDELTDVEVSESWVHLSVGDDGRREFMFQHYKNFDSENKCFIGRNGEYNGDIPGLNSTIWDAGTIDSEGIQCCLE
jgi:hypothetical protein